MPARLNLIINLENPGESGELKETLKESLSGRLMLRALAAGEQDAEQLAEPARGKLRSKRSELKRALEGRLTEVQRWVRGELLTHLEELDAGLTRVVERIVAEIQTSREPFLAEAVTLLGSIPGIGERAAQIIIAEMGVDMQQFSSAEHLSSWAGMCPGNKESAGKRRSGQTAADGVGGSGVGGQPGQRHTAGGQVSPLGETNGQKESLWH